VLNWSTDRVTSPNPVYSQAILGDNICLKSTENRIIQLSSLSIAQTKKVQFIKKISHLQRLIALLFESVLLPGDQDIVFAGQYLFPVAASQDRMAVLCGLDVASA
jgi:hypothetical protein